MQKHFYSHLVEIESLIIELEKMNFSKEEKNHLILLIQANLHHLIIDVVLSELTDEDKKIFLMHLSLESHGKIWQLLKEKTLNIEEKIKEAAESLKREFQEDIKKLNFPQ